LKPILLFALYFLSGWLGLKVNAVSNFATTVWPPSAIAFTFLVLYGVRLWPAIFLSAFALNFTHGATWIGSFGIGIGNTLEPVVACYLLRRVGFRSSFSRLKDIFYFVAFGVSLGPLISACVGATSLWITGKAPVEVLPRLWITWWMGDGIAILVLGSFLISMISFIRGEFDLLFDRFHRYDLAAVAYLILILLLTSSFPEVMAAGDLPRRYFLFPLLLWACVRFGMIGATSMTLLISSVMIWGVISGFWPFVGNDLTHSILQLEVFEGVFALTGLTVAWAIQSQRDILKRVQTSHNELEKLVGLRTRELQDYIDHMSTMNAKISPEGKIMMVNRAAQQASGFSYSELIGRQFLEGPWFRFDPEVYERVRRVFRDAIQGASINYDEQLQVQTPAGPQVVTINFSLVPIRGAQGEIDHILAEGRDITAQKELTKAQESLRLKDEFLSIVSHELRTPLTALQLQLETSRRIEQKRGGDLDITERLGSSIRQTQRLASLVDDLLDISRISSGRLKLKPEPFELGATVSEVVQRFSEEANMAKSPIRLNVSDPITGVWDHLRIEQVVANLLSNAIKYGDGKPIDVSLTNAGGAAVLKVKDEGIGIAADKIPKIFDRFERVAADPNYGGLGLGLYITRQIVEGHGGDIHVESRERHGSTFIVRLPLHPV
jgi:PAS domain S-box-containing protein